MSAQKTTFDCKQCKHYYVTWDVSHPHGCRFFAFKSAQIPALAVRTSSQENCHAFQAKLTTQSIKPSNTIAQIPPWKA